MHVRRKELIIFATPLLLAFVAAYMHWAIAGLPAAPTALPAAVKTPTAPPGFPAGVRITHYVNLLFIILLVRSGLQILMDHPRLYWNVHCTPGTEWIRFTPVEAPKDQVWTAKQDSRYLTPWIGLPGYRHTIGMARHWHFLSVLFWVANGAIYVALLFADGHWRRLVPTSEEWKSLAAGNFEDYRLKVYGLVENPVELSLAGLREMEKKTQITLHHCIQGRSGIAAWSGLPLSELLRLVRPKQGAEAVVFYSFGEGGEGGEFYDNLRLDDADHPQTILAYDMNYEPLNNLHGAPLRLRVENQLGFKMVKWIRAIEVVADIHTVGQGEGGYNEDHEYFGELANI